MNGPVTRIICLGNSLWQQDAAGPLVYRELRSGDLPARVELVDGGLAGLNLLVHLEGCDKAVFVDAMTVEGVSPGVYLLDPAEVARQAPTAYDHAAGLGYLLRMLPVIFEDDVPEVHVVGVQGPPEPSRVMEAADLALRTARQAMASQANEEAAGS